LAHLNLKRRGSVVGGILLLRHVEYVLLTSQVQNQGIGPYVPRKLLKPRQVGCPQFTTRKGYAGTIMNIVKIPSTHFTGPLKDWMHLTRSKYWGKMVIQSLPLPEGSY
jgi:hypothetical protein